MARKIEIIFNDKTSSVHFIGIAADYTLCGHDTAGDRGWNAGIETTKKVNCKQCIQIIDICKTIKSSEYK